MSDSFVRTEVRVPDFGRRIFSAREYRLGRPGRRSRRWGRWRGRWGEGEVEGENKSKSRPQDKNWLILHHKKLYHGVNIGTSNEI